MAKEVDMDVDDKLRLLWQLFGMLILAVMATSALVWFLAPKKVDGYYLSHGQNGTGTVCVYAHWTWHPDEPAFCTDRYDAAIDFQTRANASIK